MFPEEPINLMCILHTNVQFNGLPMHNKITIFFKLLVDYLFVLILDTNKYGYRMLSKMGWSEGKGLGANENGTVSHVKVSKRKDNLGNISCFSIY